MQKLAALIGLDPSSRTRIAADLPADPLATFNDEESDDYLFNSGVN